MARCEKLMFISTFVMCNLLWSHSASISRPYADDIYPSLPSEVLEVKPYHYQRSRNLKYLKSEDDQNDQQDKVIYVKLLKVNYRPKHIAVSNDLDRPSASSTQKDIFYVKALANGQFSDERLRVYYIPEFYAINVYKKNDLLQKL